MGRYTGAVKTGLITFLVAVILSSVFQLAALAVLPAVIILVVIIGVGILFDIVGTAVTAADEGSLHAMAADRVPGARWAVFLVRRADRVASFCNDVVGDICGTTSGAAGAGIVVYLAYRQQIRENILGVLMVGLIAALTVGGKAAGKRLAVSQPERIMVASGRLIMTLDEAFGSKLLRRLERVSRRERKKRSQARQKRSSSKHARERV